MTSGLNIRTLFQQGDDGAGLPLDAATCNGVSSPMERLSILAPLVQQGDDGFQLAKICRVTCSRV